MKPSLRQHLQRQAERLADLDRLLADPALMRDAAAFRRLSREHTELQGQVERAQRHARRSADRAAAEALCREAGEDDAMRAMAEEEIASAEAELARLEAELERLMLPRDPDDARDAYLEIRAGTGGDESALFAGDLLRMYLRHAERQGWQAEILSASPSELGGYKEVIVRLAGEGVYGRMRFESGGHRVQRVPATESQGRIHTSACTVAVLAEPDEAEALTLNPAELRIDTFRASGAGGQHINKTDSAVRVTHLPTGLVAECQDDRSQHRNKARALAVLAARLRDKDKLEREAREAATRRALIGSGERSDRIRTYNVPQGRLTDHRINLTLYQLGAILDGELAPVSEALIAAREAAQLAALAEAAA